MGVVFDLKRYAIHDGPGIRTTVFLKGCPLDCPWCHNPEGKRPEPEHMWWESRCLGCGSCEEACPEDAISMAGSFEVDAEKCTMCGACAEACVADALVVVGREATVEEVMEVVCKDAVFYEESGGGVTFSGGEPTMQPGFLLDLLKACRAEGFHTAVDTSGMTEKESLLKMEAYVDLFLYDLKFMDDEAHKEYTGTSNAPVLDNLRALDEAGAKIVIRVPLIPGVNDDAEDIERLGKFVSGLRGVREVCILPYHRAGTEKLGRLLIHREPFVSEPPADDKLEQVKDILESYGLKVKKGG